jgi:hypothetical protein
MPLLFADFLSANSLIHKVKSGQNDKFLVKNGIFQDSRSKIRKVSTAKNEGDLYHIFERYITQIQAIKKPLYFSGDDNFFFL